MEFNILGKVFEPTQGQVAFCRISYNFGIYAKDAVNKFDEEYKKRFNNADDLIKGAESLFMECFKEAVKKSYKNYCDNLELWDFSEEEYEREYVSNVGFGTWEEAFNPIYNRYVDIMVEKEEKIQYRQERKASRGKYEGFGFGISGAIQSSAKAGAMNMATGAAHSAFNAIGNMGTRIAASANKSELFNDKNTKASLIDALEVTIIELKYVMMDLLEEHYGYVYSRVSNSDYNNIYKLFEKWTNGEYEEEKIPEVVHRILNLSPNYKPLYIKLIGEYGDKDGEIHKLDDELWLDIYKIKCDRFKDRYFALKDKIDEEHKHEINIKDSTKEKALVELKSNMSEYEKFLGMSYRGEQETDIAGPILEELDIEIEKIANATRKIDGVMYETLEEANNVRADIKTLIDFIKEKDVNSQELKQEILEIPFITNVIIENIDEKIKWLKGLTDVTTVATRVTQVFEEETFFENSPVNKDDTLKYLLIEGQSDVYETAKNELRSFVNIGEDEVIAFIFKAKALMGSKCTWLIETNNNVYLMNTNKKGLQEQYIIPYKDVQEIVITSEGFIRVNTKTQESHLIKTAMYVAGTLMTGHKQLSNGLTRCLDVLAAFPHKQNEQVKQAPNKKNENDNPAVQPTKTANDNALREKTVNIAEGANGKKKGGIKKFILIMLIAFVVSFVGLMIIGFFSEDESEIDEPAYEQEMEVPSETIEESYIEDNTEDVVKSDYSQYICSYVRTEGPYVSFTIHDATDEKITFSALIGTGGEDSYVNLVQYEAFYDEEVESYIYYDSEIEHMIYIELDNGFLWIVDMENPYPLDIEGNYIPTSQLTADYATYNYIVPQSGNSYLTEDDLSEMSATECELAILEIYAKHNVFFEDVRVQDYFESCSWYSGERDYNSFSVEELSDVEMSNINLITQYAENKGFEY